MGTDLGSVPSSAFCLPLHTLNNAGSLPNGWGGDGPFPMLQHM